MILFFLLIMRITSLRIGEVPDGRNPTRYVDDIVASLLVYEYYGEMSSNA
jgi:hypothetical protein